MTGETLHPLSNWTKTRIFAVIELAHMWGFERVKKILTDDLARNTRWEGVPLLGNCVEEIILLHKYELRSLYLPAYFQLAKREKPISIEEGERLGLSFSLKMSAVREKHSAKVAKAYRDKLEALRGGLLTVQRNIPVPPSAIPRNYEGNQKFIKDTVDKLARGSTFDFSDLEEYSDDMLLRDVKGAFGLPE